MFDFLKPVAVTRNAHQFVKSPKPRKGACPSCGQDFSGKPQAYRAHYLAKHAKK